MDDLDAKRFKCALGFSSMIAQARTPADAEVIFGCNECSMGKLRRCVGPVEYTPPKEPIIIMPKEKNDPPRRRGHKPNPQPLEVPTPEARTAVQAIDPPVPEESKETLARKALMELADHLAPEARRDMVREVVRTFRSEIAAARKAGCGWERLSKTLRRFGYEISEYALQKNFEEMQQA
jgi:hypothetical protein